MPTKKQCDAIVLCLADKLDECKVLQEKVERLTCELGNMEDKYFAASNSNLLAQESIKKLNKTIAECERSLLLEKGRIRQIDDILPNGACCEKCEYYEISNNIGGHCEESPIRISNKSNRSEKLFVYKENICRNWQESDVTQSEDKPILDKITCGACKHWERLSKTSLFGDCISSHLIEGDVTIITSNINFVCRDWKAIDVSDTNKTSN